MHNCMCSLCQICYQRKPLFDLKIKAIDRLNVLLIILKVKSTNISELDCHKSKYRHLGMKPIFQNDT